MAPSLHLKNAQMKPRRSISHAGSGDPPVNRLAWMLEKERLALLLPYFDFEGMADDDTGQGRTSGRRKEQSLTASIGGTSQGNYCRCTALAVRAGGGYAHVIRVFNRWEI